jgi:short-subunit dehydrogenase
MSKVFITGSSDGLGKMTAELLLSQGHEVVLHARNEERAHESLKALPKAHHVVIGDVERVSQLCAAWRNR